MTDEMKEAQEVNVDEKVVLSKFEHPDGEDTTDPEFEVERLTVFNGEVVAHEVIENGAPVGPVQENNLTGQDIGRLLTSEKEVD
jgi:hypothetical protein